MLECSVVRSTEMPHERIQKCPKVIQILLCFLSSDLSSKNEMLIQRAITASWLACFTRDWLPSALFPSEEPSAYDPGPASSSACLACKQAKKKVTPSWSGNVPIPIPSVWRPFISCQRTNFWQKPGTGCDYRELFIHAFGSLDATLIGRNWIT